MSTGIVTHRELDRLIGNARRRQRWQENGRLPQGHVVTGHRERVTIFPEIVLALLVDGGPHLDEEVLSMVRACCAGLQTEMVWSPLVAASEGALRAQSKEWDYRQFARCLAASSNGRLDRWRNRLDECWHDLLDGGVKVDRASGEIAARRADDYVWRPRGSDGILEEHPHEAALGDLSAADGATRLRVSVGPLTRNFLIPSGESVPSEPGPALVVDRRAGALATFARVGRAAQSFLDTRLDPSSQDAHAHLKRAYEYTEPATEVDYEVHAEAFARSFFAINYWKVAHVLLDTCPPAGAIVDVGCGSGAAAAAALAWAEHLSTQRTSLSVRLVDRSGAQLRLAQGVLGAVAKELGNAEPQIVLEQADVRTRSVRAPQEPSLVLLSHLLTENRGAVAPILGGWVRSAPAGSRILVVEREDDPAWHEISAALRQVAAHREEGDLEFLREGLAPYGFSALTRADARPRARYADVHAPSPAARSTVECYFDSWRLRSVDLLDEVFTETATYQLGPFRDPMRGLDAIRAYWREKVLPQEHVEIAIEQIEYSKHGAVLEWEANFEQAGNAVTVRGAMRLGFTRDCERIEWLREYYTKRVQHITS